jgi:alkylation response protein AidB-like acyl-CoA dehydrogenase
VQGVEEFRAEVRDWLAENLVGEFAALKGLGGPGREHEAFQERRAWNRHLAEAGLTCLGWPVEHGGRGLSVAHRVAFYEEYAIANAPAKVNHFGEELLGPTLIAFGTPEQQRRFLPRILDVTELWCQGYSEPGSGSDLASLQTSALREGDHFVVNGQKIWTSNAQIADWMFCLVRTDKAAPKHAGISYLLIDMKAPGITIRPLLQMTKDAGFNEVFFDNVRVPVENVVGGLGQGWAVANTTLVHERNMLGSTTQTQNMFEALLRVARAAQRGGRPATEDPIVRQRLAGLKIQVEAMRLNAFRNLTATLQGRKPGIEASITKLVTCELNHQLAATALDLLGPYGTLYRGSKHLRDDGFWPYELMFSLGLIIGGGTAQIQKNIIAQRGLGLPRWK